MNTQDLINEAKQAKGIHCDGFRQTSEPHNDVVCEIIIRSKYVRSTGKYVETSRVQFWDASVRISRAKAEEILDGTDGAWTKEEIKFGDYNPYNRNIERDAMDADGNFPDANLDEFCK